MYSTQLRRAAAGVALATTASLVAVGGTAIGSAAADHHAKRINTTLKAAAPDTVPADGTAVVRGRLTARGVGLGDRPVRLLVKRDGEERWTLGRTDRTDRTGRVAFGITPAAEVSYLLWFPGSGSFQPDRSRIVTVAPRTTTVSIAASPAYVAPGGSATVSGTVLDEGSPLVGAPVQLRARKAGTGRSFEPVAAGTTGADGSVAFTVTPVRSTAYVIVVPATPTSQAGRSAIAKVSLPASSRLSAHAKTQGDTVRVSGVLRSEGRPLGYRKVSLQTMTPGATEWTTLGTRRTARDGYVVFRRAAVTGTPYRLAFAGTTQVGASTSRTVVA